MNLCRRLIVPIILCVVALAGCAESSEPESDRQGRLQVVAGFYPLAELAAEVGGQDVDVVNLTPAGAEAHDLELTPSQVDAILKADLVLLVEGFQPALEDAVSRGPDANAVDLAVGSDDDPHFWLSPSRFSEAVPKVRDALSELRPGEARQFEAGASQYGAKLAGLDGEYATGLADCEQRTFVTTHAAFGHLAAAYDLRQASIAGLSPESEPDPGRLAELADQVRELGVTTVFVEPLAPRDAAETLAREANVGTTELDPLESLRGGSEADYFTVMRANLAALRKGLGCR